MVDETSTSAVKEADLSEAAELGLEYGFGGLFIGSALNAVVSIASGNAGTITPTTFFANVLTLAVVAALVGYGFLRGYRRSKQ